MSSPPEDDDRTVMRGARASGPVPMPVAPSPAAAPLRSEGRSLATLGGVPALDASRDAFTLPVGTRLAEFELTQAIGEGGFSIVYLAWDHSLQRRVALKEYMPLSIAARVGATQVSVRSERHRDTFDAGLRSFINEARLLAQFDHPSLVKVYRFWEDHGTAYMVMPFYEGRTLRDSVPAMPQPPDEAWLRQLLASMTEALAVIHREQCFHRDVAADNILLLAGSGQPLLLDFGAARQVIGDMTQALTVILKPGYAPVEQYAEVPHMKQGPWTDVYALAAVAHWVITGKTPPPSVGRMLGDTYRPLAESAAGRFAAGFLQALDRALVVMPDRRTQNIADFRRDLGLDGADAGRTQAAAPAWADPDATQIRVGRAAPAPAPLPDETQPTAAGTAPAAQPARLNAPAIPPRPAEAGADAVSATPGRAPRWRPVVGVSLALSAAAAVYWSTRGPAEVAPAPPALPAERAAAPAPQAPVRPDVPTPPAAVAEVPNPAVAPITAPGNAAAVAGAAATGPATAAENARAGAKATAEKPAPTPGATPGAIPAPAPLARARPAVPPVIRAPEAPKPVASKTERTAKPAANSAECAGLLQRLSLGESDPALLARFNTLGCR